MSAIAGSLIGLGGAIANGVLDNLNKRADAKAKLAEAQAQKELIIAQSDADSKKITSQVNADVLKLQAELEAKMKELNANADIAESKQLIEHDMSFGSVSGLMNTLRASVRPILTYSFFLFFISYKIFMLLYAIQVRAEWTAIASVIYDAETQTLFSAIIAFWFGSRTISKFADRVSGTKKG